MILQIVILAVLILNLAAMGICAFQKRKNLLLILAVVEAVLAVVFAVTAI